MNFKTEFRQGQLGANKGLYLGPGLDSLSKAINGLQRRMMIAIASAPKTGKSTLVDYGFIIQPYLQSLTLEEKIDLKFIYFSYEMDRVTKEFDFAVYFIYHDFGIKTMQLPEGITVKGKNLVALSSDLLRGRILDDNGEIVKLNKYLIDKVKTVYENRIIPLFGEFDENGKRLKHGVIIFDEHIENPTGIYNKLMDYASKRGTFTYSEFINSAGERKRKPENYKPNNPNEFIVVIFDTIRKVAPERGYSVKQSVDKMLEYSTIIKKLCGYTFIPIIHLNRDLSSVANMNYMKDRVYPTPEMIKDTGNISEEANHVITLLNPNDDRFNLNSHFGKKLRDSAGNKLYPFLRTIHLVESRQVVYPQHFSVNMEGAIKNFSKITL